MFELPYRICTVSKLRTIDIVHCNSQEKKIVNVFKIAHVKGSEWEF